ncbi:MAG: cytochrome c biogenesis protein CcsA [Flavobacteriales bacterium]|nr:cytochrome c biogenesis protein CcsA [Flavobacteriales bacterium]
MEINYIGEQLLPGKLGHFLIVLGFVAALVSALAYYFAAKDNTQSASWRTMGRVTFGIHSVSVLGVVGILLGLLASHRFEYQYIWQHSNTEMPMKYILSSFWEGQEGSFLLWLFWHVVLGAILMFSARKWEPPVMAVFALVQAFLVSMLLGTQFGDLRLGSSPFVLLREHPDFMNLPFLQNASYLANLDGRGLNPLLQNYWMTIHPPTLFLGFAATLVPFAFAIAGLWKKQYTEWLKPALPWTYFGIMILGTGILMGGAWAYEALSFGGFWAWDPVENASLVPWITLVGAAHVMVIQKNKGQSLIITFVLTLITFILILYSTFLTRSGVLGETSVHAFTSLGMSGQLLIYLLTFLFLAILLLAFRWRDLPKTEGEESLYSREFWMFVGAMVLSISAFQISFTTSIPVINKIFGTNIAPPLDPIAHYNSWQLPLAIIVALLIAIAQYLKYRKTEPKQFFTSLILPAALALVLTVAIAIAMRYTHFIYLLMLFATLFTVTANLNYWLRVLKGKVAVAGASVAHVGFGLLLLGAFLSTSKRETISLNTSSMDVSSLGEDYSNRENILLMKGDTLRMAEYFVTYQGKRKEGVNVFYDVEYMTQPTPGVFETAFMLHPRVQTNPRMGNVAEPDTRHFLHKDIYTFVTYAEVEKPEAKAEDFKSTSVKALAIGDTLFAGNAIITFDDFERNLDKAALGLQEGDIAVGISLTAVDVNNVRHTAMPVFALRDSYVIPVDAEIERLGLLFRVKRLIPQEGKVEIELLERANDHREFIVLKALVFPWINILWGGCVIMVIGTVMAIRRRVKLG